MLKREKGGQPYRLPPKHALTFRVRAHDMKVLPSYTASAGRPKAEGREVRACQVRGQAFRRG